MGDYLETIVNNIYFLAILFYFIFRYMTFFVGLCSIFFINKWGEQNFISENALTAELINSSNDILIKNEINRIQQTINNGNIVDFLEKYFESFEMKLNNQEFSFEENGKTHKGFQLNVDLIHLILYLYREKSLWNFSCKTYK